MFAYVMIYSDDLLTIPVRLAAMIGAFKMGDSFWNPILALASIGTIIPVILAMLFQRQVVGGLTAGAVKG